jgi:invasion protein IalB
MTRFPSRHSPVALPKTSDRRQWTIAALALLVAAMAGLGGTGAAAQEGRTPAQKSPRDGQEIKDWTLRCGFVGEGQSEACEMFQQRLNDAQDTVMLTVVGKVPGGADPGMLIVVPLGVILPAGLRLKIDDGAEIDVPFQRCEPQGCLAELLLEGDLTDRLEAGRQATVTFDVIDRSGKRQRVPVPLSLFGFTAALAEVMK